MKEEVNYSWKLYIYNAKNIQELCKMEHIPYNQSTEETTVETNCIKYCINNVQKKAKAANADIYGFLFDPNKTS